jgi:hypothetical protein
MYINKSSLLFFILSIPSFILADTVNWNFNTLYGVSQNGFNTIIIDARNHFVVNPNDTIIVLIEEGTYYIGGNGSHGINFTTAGINPGPQGRLIFKGAGMNLTKLIFTDTSENMIYGKNMYRVEFSDMHMTRLNYTVTQGNVVSISPGEVILDLHDGFPSPLEIFNPNNSSGRYLRRYTNSLTNPQVIQQDNDQVAFGWRNGQPKYPEQISGNIWKFYLNNQNTLLTNYNTGDYVGVKSKHTGNTFWFSIGDDLTFRNIKWTGSTRGVARGGFTNVKIIGCRIERGLPINGQTPCLSSPAGGPQMNQNNDLPSTGMIYQNFYCDSPGDDCVAFFNVTDGIVSNSTLLNSFARGIYLSEESNNVCVINNTTIDNCSIESRAVVPNIIEWSIENAILSKYY